MGGHPTSRGDHVPNYINPENHRVTLYTTLITCISITTVLLSVRLFVRIKLLRSAGWDDLCAAIATVQLVASCSTGTLAAQYGFGYHIWDVRPEKLTTVFKLILAKCVIYNPAMLAIRMSVLFFYLRIFSYPRFRKLVYGMMALTIVVTITFIFGTIMRCMPFSYNWDLDTPGGHCLDISMFVYFNAAFSTALDLMIWALPIPILLRLGFNRRKKLALYFIFSLGLFASLAGVFRLRVLARVDIQVDPTWSIVDLGIWSQIEIAASITSACLPTLKPLFCLVFKGFFGECDGTCGVAATPRPCRRRSPHDDSILRDSFVPMGSEEVLTRIGNASIIQKEKDIERGDAESANTENGDNENGDNEKASSDITDYRSI